MLIRQRLLNAAVAAARAGVREIGANNHGPEVKKFLAEVGLPEGYAWCDAFVSYEAHAAAGQRLPIESASVAVTYREAKKLGWLASRPFKGDLVLYDFDNDGATDDHIGIVVKVKKLGPLLTLRTVEGNTSSGRAGSQADGGGVYLRTRIVRRSSVAFVRIPGQAPPGVVVKPKPKPKPRPAAKPTLKPGMRGAVVRQAQKLLAAHGAKIVVDGHYGQRTTASVRGFQRRNHLTADGVIGPKTWAKLTAKKKAS